MGTSHQFDLTLRVKPGIERFADRYQAFLRSAGRRIIVTTKQLKELNCAGVPSVSSGDSRELPRISRGTTRSSPVVHGGSDLTTAPAHISVSITPSEYPGGTDKQYGAHQHPKFVVDANRRFIRITCCDPGAKEDRVMFPNLVNQDLDGDYLTSSTKIGNATYVAILPAPEEAVFTCPVRPHDPGNR